MLIQKFTGFIGARSVNPINDSSNSRIHRADLSKALNLNAKLTSDNPNALFTLAIYTKESRYNNLNSEFFISSIETSINGAINTSSQRVFVSGENILETSILYQNFDPNDYIFAITLIESDIDVNYTLTISYEEGKCTLQTNNFFLGFWASNNRSSTTSFQFKQRSDNSIILKTYAGNQQNGFALLTIFAQNLTKTRKGYRLYSGISTDTSTYFYLNDANSNQLFSVVGGTTNPRNFSQLFNIYNRYENPNIIDFLDDTQLFTPTALFEEFYNVNFLKNNVQFAHDLKSNDYPGIGKINKLKNIILNKEIIESTTGIDIWPEMTFFGQTLSTENIINPIKTYAPLFLNDVIVTPSLFQDRNSLTFQIPPNSLETGMLVQLSNLKGNPSIGLPTEWVNGLFVAVILTTTEEFSLVTMVKQLSFNQPMLFLESYPIYKEYQIQIVARCFRVTTERSSIFFRGVVNTNDPSIVQLRNFSSVGGLSADQINRRVNICRRNSDTQFFVTTASDVIATTTEEGGNAGFVDICTSPLDTFLTRTINPYARQTCPPNPITLFFSEMPTSVNSYSRVKISGLIGEYKKLNGTHDANPTNFERFNANNNKEIWKDGYYTPNRKHYFSLRIESNGLPSFNPLVHTENGKSFTIERIVPQLTDDSNYGDFADACLYLFWKQGVNTHAISSFYPDLIEGTRNPTWEAIQFQIANFQTFQLSTRNRGDDYVSAFPYFNSNIDRFGNFLNKNSFDDEPGNPINQSLRFDPSRSFVISLNIKYLIPGQIFNTYARVSGPVLNERVPGSDPTNQNISNFTASLGYIGNGTVVEYLTSNLDINPFLGIFFNRNTPEPPSSFLLTNAYQIDGFTRKEFSGELILANPPVGVSLSGEGQLFNAADCKGKIVVYVEISNIFGFNDQTIYSQAVAAGAIGVIVVTEDEDAQFSYAFSNIDGPINDIMIYASSFSIGNALINYNGVGDRNDPNSYGLSIGPSSGYIGDFKIAQSNGRRIGDSTFQFGVIKPEFSQNKDVGYIYFPNLAFADITEFNPIFWEEYGVSTLIDQYARIFAAILETKVVTGSGEIKRFSEMDSLIIDNASNRGGEDDLMAAFATFFGNNRPSLSVVVSSSGTGFSASNIITEKLLPSSDIIKLNFWTSSTDLQCDKYQKKYPNAAFKGEKVIFLSSTSAFSAGDVSPHYFRNTRDNENSFGNLGKSVISDKKVSSILIGNIDGRLQGRADNLPNLVSFSRTSVFSFIPSVMGITAPLISYRVVGEDQYTLYNTYTGEPITSQLPEIKIDGINNEGPMNVWFEDDGGFFQAFGFSSVYLRGKNPRYDRFKIISEKPIPYNLLTYHYPFIEDAIIAATNNI